MTTWDGSSNSSIEMIPECIGDDNCVCELRGCPCLPEESPESPDSPPENQLGEMEESESEEEGEQTQQIRADIETQRQVTSNARQEAINALEAEAAKLNQIKIQKQRLVEEETQRLNDQLSSEKKRRDEKNTRIKGIQRKWKKLADGIIVAWRRKKNTRIKGEIQRKWKKLADDIMAVMPESSALVYGSDDADHLSMLQNTKNNAGIDDSQKQLDKMEKELEKARKKTKSLKQQNRVSNRNCKYLQKKIDSVLTVESSDGKDSAHKKRKTDHGGVVLKTSRDVKKNVTPGCVHFVPGDKDLIATYIQSFFETVTVDKKNPPTYKDIKQWIKCTLTPKNWDEMVVTYRQFIHETSDAGYEKVTAKQKRKAETQKKYSEDVHKNRLDAKAFLLGFPLVEDGNKNKVWNNEIKAAEDYFKLKKIYASAIAKALTALIKGLTNEDDKNTARLFLDQTSTKYIDPENDARKKKQKTDNTPKGTISGNNETKLPHQQSMATENWSARTVIENMPLVSQDLKNCTAWDVFNLMQDLLHTLLPDNSTKSDTTVSLFKRIHCECTGNQGHSTPDSMSRVMECALMIINAFLTNISCEGSAVLMANPDTMIKADEVKRMRQAIFGSKTKPPNTWPVFQKIAWVHITGVSGDWEEVNQKIKDMVISVKKEDNLICSLKSEKDNNERKKMLATTDKTTLYDCEEYATFVRNMTETFVQLRTHLQNINPKKN